MKSDSENRGVTNQVAGKLIMVCGAARSGTTMLDLMLGNSTDAISTGEISRLFRPFRKHHKNPVCSCGEADCPVWRGLTDGPESGSHENIFGKRPEINFVVDSSKDLRWIFDSNLWADRANLPLANVVIWKDPIDLSYSYWRRGESVDWYRKAFLTYYERFLDLKLPFVSVNYKQLVTDANGTLEALCNTLGIDYSDARVNFWEKRHHHFFGSTGTRSQIGNEGATLSYKTEYPDEFIKLFELESKWIETDKRFSRVVSELRAHDVSRGLMADGKEFLTVRRPLWYYRHSLKALWWKYYPMPVPEPHKFRQLD
jgi:hypothetical protein